MLRWVLYCPMPPIKRSTLMDFSLTEEQELLLASIRELITSNFRRNISVPAIRRCRLPIRKSLCAPLRTTEFHAGRSGRIRRYPRLRHADAGTPMEASNARPAFLITNGQCIHRLVGLGPSNSYVKRQKALWKRRFRLMRWH